MRSTGRSYRPLGEGDAHLLLRSEDYGGHGSIGSVTSRTRGGAAIPAAGEYFRWSRGSSARAVRSTLNSSTREGGLKTPRDRAMKGPMGPDPN